jgi:hypothetical protein
MKPGYEELTQQLADCFAPINEALAGEISAHMRAPGSFFASYRLEIAPETLRHLIEILAHDGALWLLFRDAVWLNRQLPSRFVLAQQALTVGRWQGLRERLDAALPQLLQPALRQRFVRYLNDVDGALGRHRAAFDDDGLAPRINQQAGVPLVDGLLLRGLALVLAENPSVRSKFRSLVEALNPTIAVMQGLRT